MSRADVRRTIVTFLQPVSRLNVIYPTFPRFNPAQAFVPSPGAKSGAVAVLFIASETETREAFGGWKRNDYECQLHVFHRSIEAVADDAMAHFDALMDEIKDQLRSDHNFGDATVVWLGAESSEVGVPDISTRYSEPMLDGQILQTEGVVEFKVFQQIQTV